MATKKKQTFEEQLNAVETLISKMEQGGQNIEEAIKDYESGLKMIGEMEKDLTAMKQKMTVLSGGVETEVEDE